MVVIKAFLALEADQIQTYFQTLYMFDLLKERFMDLPDPMWADLIPVLSRIGRMMYFVVEEDTGVILGEFTIEPAQGKAGLIHFSLLPGIPWARKVHLCRYCAHQVLTQWHDDRGNPFVQTLVGLTPLQNRAACLTVLRVGYTKVGIIPHAAYFAATGTTGDCMASILTKETADGWERTKYAGAFDAGGHVDAEGTRDEERSTAGQPVCC